MQIPKAQLAIFTERCRHHPASEGIALYGETGSILAEPGRCVLRDRADWLGDILPWSNAGRWPLAPTSGVAWTWWGL